MILMGSDERWEKVSLTTEGESQAEILIQADGSVLVLSTGCYQGHGNLAFAAVALSLLPVPAGATLVPVTEIWRRLDQMVERHQKARP